jgi:hypothetical protein
MSHFIGPNMYLIESAVKDGLYLNLDGGNKADGTKVLTRYGLFGLSGGYRLLLIPLRGQEHQER